MTAFCKINALTKYDYIGEDIAKARLLKYHFKYLIDEDEQAVKQKYKGESFMKTLRRNEFSGELTRKKFE